MLVIKTLNQLAKSLAITKLNQCKQFKITKIH